MPLDASSVGTHTATQPGSSLQKCGRQPRWGWGVGHAHTVLSPPRHHSVTWRQGAYLEHSNCPMPPPKTDTQGWGSEGGLTNTQPASRTWELSSLETDRLCHHGECPHGWKGYHKGPRRASPTHHRPGLTLQLTPSWAAAGPCPCPNQ